MPQTYLTTDLKGKAVEITYEAYRWRDQTHFIMDHRNGENTLELRIDGHGNQVLFGWGFQSHHDSMQEMFWVPTQADFPEEHKRTVAVNLKTRRTRPSEHLADSNPDGLPNPTPFVRKRPSDGKPTDEAPPPREPTA